jgi:hypothetical protein
VPCPLEVGEPLGADELLGAAGAAVGCEEGVEVCVSAVAAWRLFLKVPLAVVAAVRRCLASRGGGAGRGAAIGGGALSLAMIVALGRERAGDHGAESVCRAERDSHPIEKKATIATASRNDRAERLSSGIRKSAMRPAIRRDAAFIWGSSPHRCRPGRGRYQIAQAACHDGSAAV